MEAHNTLITYIQESIVKLQDDLSSTQEVDSALQTQLEGVTVEQSSLDKEMEKSEGGLGVLSNLYFSFENINTLTNIV